MMPKCINPVVGEESTASQPKQKQTYVFGQNAMVLMQDAHNLAWKLAAVVQGQAGEDLLRSYGAERRPIAQANADLSVANFQDAIRIPQALGLDPRAANFLHSAVSSLPMSLFPSGEPAG